MLFGNLKKARCLPHQLNFKTNESSFVIKDYLKVLKLFPATCHLTDDMGGNELKLEKIGQFFRVLMLHVPKILKKFIMVSPL